MIKKMSQLVITLYVILICYSLAFAGNNLLINPDAETGATQGWTDPDNAWSADNEVTPHGGNYFFWPQRLDLPNTMIYQDINVSGFNAGTAYLHLSGWLANYDQYPHDRSTLAVEALDSNNGQLLYLSRYHRSPSWTYYRIDAQIPAGTVILRVYLIATRFVGSDNDGYFDDLSLEVDNVAPTVAITVTSEANVKEIIEGGTLQLSAASTDSADSSYIWTSSFDAVASVNEKGLVSAHKAGRAVIQAEGNSSHATGYLEIVVYSSNSLIFTNPQSGVKWGSGTNQNISWELKGSLVSGTLFYSTKGGAEWIKITDISDLTVRQYSWLVPDVNTVMNDCVVKMIWSGGEAVSSVFTIFPKAELRKVSGTVTTSIAGHTGLSVINAVVSLQETDYSAVTDVNGSFILSDIPTGNYVLHIGSPGLIPVSENISVTAGQDLSLGTKEMKVWIDGSIGLDEAIYALQVVSGIRK